MTRPATRRTLFLTGAVLTALTAAAFAAPAPVETTETVKDRAGFVPYRKFNPLPGKAVGVLVSDVAEVMRHDGRSGPPNAYAFSAGGGSYRWVYVPVSEKPNIPALNLRVGEKGDKTRAFKSLSMASADTVKQWDITAPYALVEVEVNGGDGTPAEEGFCATKMKRLDDTKEYPLKVPEVVAELRTRYRRHAEERQKTVDAALAEAQQAAVKDKKPTGPRVTEETVYITWMPETERLRVHFRSRVADGCYEVTGVGGPRPPIKPGAAAALPPPPPPRRQFMVGTMYGVESGVAYEVSKTGRVERVLLLPDETFHTETRFPVGGRPSINLPVKK